jgi:hypothetical protein
VRAFFMTGDPGSYGVDGLLALGARQVFFKPLDMVAVEADLRRSLMPGGSEEPPPRLIASGATGAETCNQFRSDSSSGD